MRIIKTSKFLFFVIIINLFSIDVLAAQNITFEYRNFVLEKTAILAKNHSSQTNTKFTFENYLIRHQGINILDISIQYSSFLEKTSLISYKKVYLNKYNLYCKIILVKLIIGK
jgi:hypothetical protein